MSNTSNLVAIIVPLYNRAELIPETIRSVVAQTDSRWELIIIDDGSSDNSIANAVRASENDPRIHIRERVGNYRGANICRNQGLEQADSNWCMFLDSDDILAPNCIKDRVAKIESSYSIDFAVFPTAYFDKYIGDRKDRWFEATDDPLSGFINRPLWPINGPIWKTNTLRNLGGFRENLQSWQDWELHIRALTNNLTFQWMDGRADSYVRRGHMSRVSSNSEKNQAQLHERIDMFAETFCMIRDSGKMNRLRRDLFVRRFLTLAFQLNKNQDTSGVEKTLQTVKRLAEPNSEEWKTINSYFHFETRAFFRRNVFGRAIRPWIKLKYRWQLGNCILSKKIFR